MNITTQKLIPFLVLLLLAAAPLAKAQDYYESEYQYKRVSLGIMLTPSVSWLRYGDNNEFSNSSKLGFGYGLAADFGVSENYYFSTGLIINTLNSETTNSSATPSSVHAYRLQYAEIPVSVKLKSTQRYFRSYYGQFGFTTGFKLSGREAIDGARRSKVEDANILRLGLLIGGGVEWQLDHNLALTTGLSFNNGFTRAVKLGEPKSSYFGLNLGVFF